MTSLFDPAAPSRLSYACYDRCPRTGEQFVPQHVLSYQLAGQATVSDGEQTHVFAASSLRLIRRNRLFKFTKQPSAGGGEFRAVAVVLDQSLLQAISREQAYPAGLPPPPTPIIWTLPPHALYQSYFESLRPYGQLAHVPAELQALKAREAVLLHLAPTLRGGQIDFADSGKVNLAAFIERNFRFNVLLSQFAYLTGSSLATFKRDFTKLFRQSPGRWLVQRRLREAYFLLTGKGQTPADVYLTVGFEDLSHFSFAFKKAYGLAPSRLGGRESWVGW